ncbi:hypothetical protein [Actinokineospora globicatena]|uniref:hypothetical protein n=1 Tax=Actinokineospora globicatena TaxID=103729 RepID=UPI0025551605|nr:hypothetical protein [Actinokineospora globicatena]
MDDYNPVREQLLVRTSPVGPGGERVDVLFRGVKAIKMATHFPSLCVRVATGREVRRGLSGFRHLLRQNRDLIPFVVCEEPGLGFVIATLVTTVSDNYHNLPSTMMYEFTGAAPPEVVSRLV